MSLMRACAIEYVLYPCGCQYHKCKGCNEVYYEYKEALVCAESCARRMNAMR